MKSDAAQRQTLSQLGAAVWANRHHGITQGGAGHDEVRAARAAVAARDSGMTDTEIADVMHLTVDEIGAWLGR